MLSHFTRDIEVICADDKKGKVVISFTERYGRDEYMVSNH